MLIIWYWFWCETGTVHIVFHLLSPQICSSTFASHKFKTDVYHTLSPSSFIYAGIPRITNYEHPTYVHAVVTNKSRKIYYMNKFELHTMVNANQLAHNIACLQRFVGFLHICTHRKVHCMLYTKKNIWLNDARHEPYIAVHIYVWIRFCWTD